MKTIQIEVPDDAFAALRLAPEEFARELRLAAAIQWYRQCVVSQGKAAEIAGLARADFIDELARRKVNVTQVDKEELEREIELG